MKFNITEFMIAIAGSSALGGLLVWIYNKIRAVGLTDSANASYHRAVDVLKQRQEDQATKMLELDGKLNQIKQDTDLRLTKIEVEIVHIRELQAQHNYALSETSKDVKKLLSRGV